MRKSLAAELWRVAEIVCFGALPMLVLALAVKKGYASGIIDFHWYWSAGRDVLHGVSPYPSVADARRAAGGFVYPPPTAVAIAPLALMSFHAAAVLFTFVGIAC